MSFRKALRVKRSRAHAARLRDALEKQEFAQRRVEHDVVGVMKPDCVLDHADGLVTTEVGFVTMTLLATHAIYRDSITLLPGCDDEGQQGYLVFVANRVPFHSLAANPRDASVEAQAAHRRADGLVNQFGGKAALKSNVRSLPWYQICTFDDAYRAGLCEWGVRSFLGRYKIRRVALAIGIPSLLLRGAGSYGERISAARLLRLNEARAPRARSELS